MLRDSLCSVLAVGGDPGAKAAGSSHACRRLSLEHFLSWVQSEISDTAPT